MTTENRLAGSPPITTASQQHKLLAIGAAPPGFERARVRPGIRGKVRELRPQTRHGEVHEGTDLRNRKPALRCDNMDRQRGVLVRPQYDLQPAIQYMLGDLIGERPRHAMPVDSRSDCRADAVDEQTRRKLHGARDRRPISGWKAP